MGERDERSAEVLVLGGLAPGERILRRASGTQAEGQKFEWAKRVNQIPDVEQPVLVVNIAYPGASPDTVEHEFVNRIEESMQSIAGVDQVRATASEGNARLVLIFNFNKNMVEAADEVRNAIGSVRHKLATEIREPVLQRLDPAAQPIMHLALSSTQQSHAAISRLAEDQSDRFRALKGVASVIKRRGNDVIRRGVSRMLQRFKLWFDHQADRYGRVIAWALHHRRWMALFAVLSLAGALGLQMRFGGSSFLPSADSGTLAIEVRTPSSSNLEYSRLKLESAAALARTMPETVATNSVVNSSGGRIYVDIGKSNQRKRSASAIAIELRGLVARLVGAEYVVLDDLNNGAAKPVQIRFSGTDSRKLLALTNDFMARLRAVPGAVDVGLSEQDPQDELKIELDRGLANALGISVAEAAQALRVAFAGVEVGDWIDPTGEARDVAVRLHPDDRVDASNIERLPIAVAGSNRVMLSLPLSLIGVALALLLTGGTLNLMSFIGVIMLMGLVAKNAILLLDAARVQQAQGVAREQALMTAGRKRLRPILMTTFALIAGMLPVAIGLGEGSEFYRPRSRFGGRGLQRA